KCIAIIFELLFLVTLIALCVVSDLVVYEDRTMSSIAPSNPSMTIRIWPPPNIESKPIAQFPFPTAWRCPP
ncbi:hypothetical protein, partial [Mesorhizobium sp. YR577]|uniref:hypothetical protein n=1 Tax=Mesorhizobium sp. YR577 TaxID=1884373 RepID=UPI001AECF087